MIRPRSACHGMPGAGGWTPPNGGTFCCAAQHGHESAPLHDVTASRVRCVLNSNNSSGPVAVTCHILGLSGNYDKRVDDAAIEAQLLALAGVVVDELILLKDKGMTPAEIRKKFAGDGSATGESA